jgi:hypothetical protein
MEVYMLCEAILMMRALAWKQRRSPVEGSHWAAGRIMRLALKLPCLEAILEI